MCGPVLYGIVFSLLFSLLPVRCWHPASLRLAQPRVQPWDVRYEPACWEGWVRNPQVSGFYSQPTRAGVCPSEALLRECSRYASLWKFYWHKISRTNCHNVLCDVILWGFWMFFYLVLLLPPLLLLLLLLLSMVLLLECDAEARNPFRWLQSNGWRK